MKAQLCSGGVEGGSDESVTIASTSAREEDDSRIGVGATSHKSHFHFSQHPNNMLGMPPSDAVKGDPSKTEQEGSKRRSQDEATTPSPPCRRPSARRVLKVGLPNARMKGVIFGGGEGGGPKTESMKPRESARAAEDPVRSKVGHGHDASRILVVIHYCVNVLNCPGNIPGIWR